MSGDDEALLQAFERLERIVKAEFGESRDGSDRQQLVRLIALLDDVQRVTAQMREARDALKNRMDGAASGLSATSAYGQAGRLGHNR